MTIDEQPSWTILAEFCVEDAFVRIEQTAGDEGAHRAYFGPTRESLDSMTSEDSFDPLALVSLADAVAVARHIVDMMEERTSMAEALAGLRSYQLVPFDELDD